VSQALAEAVVRGMLDRDAFSAWLGIEVTTIRPRSVECRMRVRPDMLNGFGVCHGAVTFALADSALAFASNTSGWVTVSIENSMTYPAAVRAGDLLVATAEEESATNRLAFFRVVVRRDDDTVVGLFRGTVYRTERRHPAADGGAPAPETDEG
jgi:acyl-CoA thioesterase